MIRPHINLSMRFAVIVFCSIYYTLVNAESLIGRVVAIADGDTITILDSSNLQHKIRLTGIDAPEKKQAFGQLSKQHLADLVFDRVVTIEWLKKDRYKRTLGKVIANGQDVNLEQLKTGLAWHYKQYEREQPPTDRLEYAEAEDNARSKHIGLWRDTSPVPPWEFRHQNK